MKLIRSFILAGIIFRLQPAYAQSGPQLIPSGQVPNTGTFWLVIPAIHNGYSVAPCPPVSAFNDSPYDVYYLADGMYLVDNTAETGGLNTNELNSASDLVLDVIAESVAGMNAQVEIASPMTGFSMMSSSLSSTYAYGNPVYLTNMVAHFVLDGSVTASFRIAGGTNFVPYDILTATNLRTPVGYWDWLGIGYTSNNYTFYEQPTNMAFYILAKPSKTMTAALGDEDDSSGQYDVPFGLTNVVQIAAGGAHNLALKSDGTVTAWGWNIYGQTDVPTNLSGVAMVAAGWNFSVAMFTNGTVTAWGEGEPGLPVTNVPPDLTNAVLISAEAWHTLALRSNGTLEAWGEDDYGETNIPAGLTNVVAISAGWYHNLAVKADGTVVAWGDNSYGQTNVPVGLSNVVDVAAGLTHSLALLKNGTVVAWGTNDEGEANVPVGLSNVVAIAANGFDSRDPYLAYSMALKSDGTVVIWGNDETNPVEGLSNVIAISAGADDALALRTGPPTPVITEEPIDQYQLTNGTVTFNSRGAGLYGVTYQWQFKGMSISGATNAALTVTNAESTNAGGYTVTVTDNGGMGSVVSSNANLYLLTRPVILSQSPLPANQVAIYQTNLALAVVAGPPAQGSGFPLSYQWQLDGTNLPGATSSSYNFTALYSGAYSVVVTNAVGSVTDTWQIALVYPGAVFGWGSSSNGELNASPTLTNVISLAAGEAHGVVALDSGSVSNWGAYWAGSSFVPVAPPPTITNAIAVAAGSRHDLALLQNGAVVAWGLDDFGQTNVPASATNLTAIAAGGQQSLALLQNGIVLQWGQTNAPVPANLTNVTAIAAGTNFCLALLTNSTVVAWGANNFGQTNVPVGLTNVVAIAAGGSHALALQQNGTVVAWGDNTYGETNVPAGLSNVMSIAAGDNHSIAVQNDGTFVAWGDNTFGETSSVTGFNEVKLIAGGDDFTLGVQFSPTVMYPVNVSQDLLLVYNSNSSDSSNICSYYLAHRPMVANANVLGVDCEIDMGEFYDTTNTAPNQWDPQVVTPILNWLTNNPTKHPTYVILFYDIPTRVWISTNNGCGYPNYFGSTSYQIHSLYPGWKPFVNNINGGSLADCEAYVDKIAHMATNSPDKLVISASAAGYRNTDYYFDDTETNYFGDPVGLSGARAVIAEGVSSNSVIYTNVNPDCGSLECHLSSGTNVAGYFCWGEHSSLDDNYPTNGFVQWSGNSGWWIIQTMESFNGQRGGCAQGDFVQWFSSSAFGGTNYSDTPVGAVSHVEEPQLSGVENPAVYFGLWAAGKNFGICA
ncbi:MAG TPA: hypothetical protein VGY56_21145 [Verrucomicrobiae bacterium]|nr:hypothetical protein [Verrucomicrobiae bacterium]